MSVLLGAKTTITITIAAAAAAVPAAATTTGKSRGAPSVASFHVQGVFMSTGSRFTDPRIRFRRR